MNHVWFKGVDWNAVKERKIPAPWIPNVRNELDTHYFEHYAENEEQYESLNDDEQQLFADF